MKQSLTSVAITLSLSVFFAAAAFASGTADTASSVDNDTIVLGKSLAGNPLVIVHRIRTLIGPVLVGGSARDEVYIENPTNSLLTIGVAAIGDEDTDAFSIDQSQFPLQLAAGAEVPVFFTFHPRADKLLPEENAESRHCGGQLILHLYGGAVSNGVVSLAVGGIAVGDTSTMVFASHENAR